MIRILILCLVFCSMPALASGEAGVFGRLLARMAPSQSTTISRFALTNSPAGKELCTRILGAEASSVADDLLAVTTIRRLAERGEHRLASEIEQRLKVIEDDTISEMARTPSADLDALIDRLALERLSLRAKATNSGKARLQFASPAKPSTAEQTLEAILMREESVTALQARIEEVALRSPELGVKKIAYDYEAFITAFPGTARYLPKARVYSQLTDEEMTYYNSVLVETLAAAKKAPAALEPSQRIRYALRKVLRGRVPADTIESRIQALFAGERDSFRRAMGDMTLEEVHRLVHGGNPLSPTPESLLGQYLRETQAATVVREFEDFAAREAGQATAMGPKKLVVSVSQESFPIFQRLFKRPEWFSIVDHAAIIHNGTRTTHYQQFDQLAFSNTENKPLPMVLLKTTEAQRMEQYLKLFRRDRHTGAWANAASNPWDLGNYCARSAWAENCTQHIGNIPIGDERVIEYTVPAQSYESTGKFIFRRLRPHNSADPLISRVWKLPGNKQLAEVLGQQKANIRGEFANPGWLISTLLGPVTTERVPIVFILRQNHRLPVPADFTPQIEGRF